MTQDYILLSGGLDSAALAYILAKGQGQQLRALYVDHGQRASSPELSSAHKIAHSLSINLKVIDATGLWPSFRDIAEPTHVHIMTSSAKTMSPGIAIAACYAAMAGANKLILGLVKEDIDGRPWLLDLLGHYQAAARCVKPSLTGFPPGDEDHSSFVIEAPVAHLPKSALIQQASQFGAPLHETWSCQFSSVEQCGTCYICRNRKNAFRQASVIDPTMYTDKS
ncbi:7-cyano-7-deazaguanine synthase [Aeromonas veronii]|uniref:7-cyano-7-deazaguanine synthase n=1 Tax=Aeromonas veronii TaxID=654 RepID=UPI0007BB90AB|nr:7-cyano-7-deazaguanine synthase [Aeromonas veronii]KZW95874.1 hypothetical protein WM54_11600 [Aeromonas veronii]